MPEYEKEIDDGALVAHAKAWVQKAKAQDYAKLDPSLRCAEIVNLARKNEFDIYGVTTINTPIFQPSLILVGCVHKPEVNSRVAHFIDGLCRSGHLDESTTLLMEGARGKLDRRKTFQLEYALCDAEKAIGRGTYQDPEDPGALATVLKHLLQEQIHVNPEELITAHQEGNHAYIHAHGVLVSQQPSYFLNQLGILYARVPYEFDDTTDKKLLAEFKPGLPFDELTRLLMIRATTSFASRLATLEFDKTDPLQRPLTVQTFGVLDALVCSLPRKVASLTLIPQPHLLPEKVRDFISYIEQPEQP